MCTSQTHLKMIIHQNWTWMKKWNTSPSKAMKTCALFPIFTELEPERMSGGYTFHYVLGTICIKLWCFEWSQNYLYWEKQGSKRPLYFYQKTALIKSCKWKYLNIIFIFKPSNNTSEHKPNKVIILHTIKKPNQQMHSL